ncbi:calcium-activated chloride channel regulator 2-like [Elgaria multicarinata webbii]|uniref:calcium-activated chloride channel regulator 2-like n=1 Tax=Elgaria multicarinata webbii TaxID=159646 RepID=UPI002FCCC2E8
MMTEASFYLFNATHGRVYFGSIKILIPATWKANTYAKPKQELYTKADVIVAPPYWKHGHDPYTLQYGGCGEKGKYIHFTPDFLVNDSSIGIYGSRGRLFVHEWAHLQWGVFDEYDSEKPFYISGQNQVKATRCSSELTGIYVCEKESCTQGNCVIDQGTGLLKEGCVFMHDKDQNASSSIMYMQSLSSVFEFCDASNHNTEAPSPQNRMCSYKSTWDVIRSSDDFKFNIPLNSSNFPLPPTFSLLQATDRVICLVLDFSNSMTENNRLNRMRQAVEAYLLQIVEENSYVGIVTFSNVGEVKSQIQQIISANVRKQLASDLPVASFGKKTNVCAGLKLALEVLKNHDGNASGSEIILLTSGGDSTLNKCFSDVVNVGLMVHTIVLGQSASRELEKLGRMTGGLTFFASDRPDSNSLIEAFTAIVAGHGDTSHQPVQIESAAERVNGNSQINRTTTIDSTVGKDTFFLVTWQTKEPAINLRDPRGKSYTIGNFNIDPILHIARLQIPEIAEVGDWTYTLTNTHPFPDVFTMTVTSRAVKPDVPAISVRVHTNKDTNLYPSPVIVYAQVNQGFSPILGANVTAVIEPEDGDPIILDLFDSGAGADIIKNDGVYSKYLFSFTRNGRYSLKVHVQRDNKAIGAYPATLWSHAMYIPGYITNGTIQMNAPRPLMNNEDTQLRSGSFSRIASGCTFMVSAIPTVPSTDVFPPCKIIDLDAGTEDDKVVLTWTAPGDDFDQGQAGNYDIRTSESPLELRDNFEMAASINTSILTPQRAGSKEAFVFKPEAFTNMSLIYVAIRTTDKAFLYSDVSNIAQAVILLQNDRRVAPAKYSALAIVLTTCGLLSLVASCLILSTGLWTLKKRKKESVEDAL